LDGFGSKFELDRHTNTVHSRQIIFCPVAGCNRAEDAPVKWSFRRLDNLTDHTKRKHPIPSGSGTRSVSVPGEQNERSETVSQQSSDERETPAPRKKRRRSDSEDEPDSALRRIEMLEREIERRNIVENELRAEVKRLQVQTETLMKIVTNLSQQNR
jgi:hypothetical protein